MNQENLILRPRPGTIKRVVYDELDYQHGQLIEDLMLATKLERKQVYQALIGMEESGLVERHHRGRKGYRETFWFRIGAHENNDPTTVAPGSLPAS